MNRRGENGSREGIAFTEPSAISSLINNPVTGAQRMPQQLCPYAQTTFAVPGTRPRTGIASGAHGLMHACSILGFCPRAKGAMPWKDATAAATPVCGGRVDGVVAATAGSHRRDSDTATDGPDSLS